MQTIVNLVSAGIGVAWVPASLMQLQRPGVVYRPLAGAPLSSLQFGLQGDRGVLTSVLAALGPVIERMR